jgi:hypothetical protein
LSGWEKYCFCDRKISADVFRIDKKLRSLLLTYAYLYKNMNKYLFLIIWSLISPSCAGLIAHFLRIHLPAWNPGYKDIRISIAIYLAYWLPLGFLQAGVLFWKLRDRKFAYKWFLRTSITGFLVMLSYDLVITSMQAGDRVVVVLAFFLPFLVLAGGLILGSVQLSQI